MEDFNADNRKLDAALTGLDSQVSGLGGQLSGLDTRLSALDTQVAGLPIAKDLKALKTSLEGADRDLSKLINEKHSVKKLRLSSEEGFVAAADGSRYVLDTSGFDLYSHAAYAIDIYAVGSGLNTLYLRAISGSGSLGCCFSTQGSTDKGMAIIPPGGSTMLVFFPMRDAVHIMGLFFYGKNCGVGYAGSYFSQTTGLALYPASGTVTPGHSFSTTLYYFD